MSVIGESLYSDEAKPNWYALIRPTNITDYGTLTRLEYLGNRKTLPLVSAGEIVFGCEATWRSLVLCEAIEKCTTNFHGTVLYWPGAELNRVIWLRCMLDYMREIGILRHIAVGGQGGHLSPDYFGSIPIANFPDSIQEEVARCYFRQAPPLGAGPDVDNLVDWHRRHNAQLGIWDLDSESRHLRRLLRDAQDQVIQGHTVKVAL
ncbi:MAG: hypothetical protein ACM3VX_08550 [Bacteroidota bacterium]